MERIGGQLITNARSRLHWELRDQGKAIYISTLRDKMANNHRPELRPGPSTATECREVRRY